MQPKHQFKTVAFCLPYQFAHLRPRSVFAGNSEFQLVFYTDDERARRALVPQDRPRRAKHLVFRDDFSGSTAGLHQNWDFEVSKDNIRIAGSAILLLVTTITFISTSLAIKTQYFIIAAIALSLISIFLILPLIRMISINLLIQSRFLTLNPCVFQTKPPISYLFRSTTQNYQLILLRRYRLRRHHCRLSSQRQ